MRIPSVLFFCLLPLVTIAEYDESSTRKINLEDIEDDHIKNERQSQSMPPPLSKQPAKGQPVQLYPPLSNEAYPIPSLFNVHHYSTRAHHHAAHVQPLTDQPTAPAPAPSEAGYQHQQLPSAYRGEEIVYIPAEGQHQSPHNPQQLYDVGGVGSVGQQQLQQPSPHFYYSHDLPPHQHPTAGSGNAHENEYQIQFIPIEQHGGSAEQQQQQQQQHHHQLQHSYHGPSQVIVPSTAAPVEPVSYSHDMAYDGVLQPEMHPHPSYHHQNQHQQQQQQQQQEPAQYQINNGIREPNAQHVYGLPPDVLFQSQKDIEYAKPAENYGPPPLEYFKKEPYSQRDFSQVDTSPKTRTTPESSYQGETSYSDQIKSIDYQSSPSHQLDSSSSNSQTSYRQKVKAHESALSYGYDNQVDQLSKSTTEPKTYFSKQQTEFKYNQASAEENKIPAISDGYQDFPAPSAPSETQTYYLNHLKAIKAVHHADSVNKPAIIYGPPGTVGKEPQIEYGAPDAPFRRPVAQSNQDIYAPRRPSSAGRSYGKSFAVSFPYPPSFVSFTTEKSSAVATGKSLKDFDSSANNDVNPWRPMHVSPSPNNQYRSFGQISESTDSHQPIPDFFHTRRAKSLLDSYIPSWLVARMQEQHARQGSAISSTQAEDAYNTISYSSQENVNGNHFKRSISKKKDHQKKKVQASNEEMTAME